MNDRLKMVQSLLLEALEIETTQERAAFLSEASGGDEKLRAQVEALIAAQIAAGQFLPDRPSRNTARAAWAGIAATGTCADGQFQISVTEKPGDWIGHYRLLEKLGEGGCGLVYMAEQEKPVRRKVALKVIKLGMDTRQVLARFEAERQALALMDHPNIAKVLDAGASAAGRPFFVMELVRGVRITNFCDQQEFPTRARLEMFIKVCQAVQHAHQKGIVHRDIKPSNILVADHDGVPVPKIIDFGIAKATTDQRLTDKTLFTSLDQVIGTPTYMSPEQANLGGVDIDTRSDIYSLGVLLYELLTGRTPFDTTRLRQAGLDELRRIIREEEPLRPSTKLRNLQAAHQMTVARHQKSDPTKLVNLLRGDLDWIVMKALEKDRNRRYETVNGLAMDIQRHLNNEPVVARPAGKFYKFRKLVLRNKRGFTAVAATAMALVLGLALSLWQAMRATRAEGKARDSAGRAQLAKEDEAKQRRAAEQARRQSEENGIRLVHALDRAEMQRVEEFFSGDDSSSALAYLARLLRRDPANETAAERLLSGLTLRGYALRLAPPLRHEGTVFCVQFSPDGRRVVTASDDSTARVWDAQTGQPLTPPLRHSSRVWFAEFSPDGKRVVTASKDHTARIWDAQTGQLLTEPLKHGDDVSFARFSSDGRRVITASDDHTARIWETETGQPLTDPLRHGEHVQYAEFSPDGRWVVTASDDKTARVWDGRTGQPLSEPLKHESRVWFAQFSPDGLRVVTASGDKTARVWDAQSGRPLTESLKHEGEVLSARFSPDGERLVSSSEDRTARIWDTKTGKMLTEPLKHQGKVFTASFSMDGQQVVTASDDRTARVWDARTGKALTESLKHEDSVRYAQFSPDGLRVITASEDQTAQVWDAQPRHLLAEPLWHADHVTCAQFSPDGKRVVTGSDDSTAQVWDTETAQALIKPLRHSGPITSVRFSPDGDRVLTASVDHTARIWDARTGNPLGEPLRHSGAVNSAEFSNDGLKIVTASEDGTSQMWNTKSGRPLNGPLRHAAGVLWAEFGPDGKLVVTAGGDNTARIWDAQTRQPHTVPLKHANIVSFARFSQDGKRIATGCYDGTARVWDANTGEPLTSPLRHEDRVTSGQFSPDGKRVVTGSWDRTARIWDSHTGQPLTEPLKHKDHIETAQFSGDSHRVVTVSDDGTARVWDVQTGQALTEPLRHGDRINLGTFSSDNQRVLTASADTTARVWDVPSVVAPVPGWVTEVVEQIATKRVNDYSVLESVPFNRFPALRAQIITSTNQDIWTRWGKWLFAEASLRTVSAFSDLRVPAYVKQRIKQSNLADLQEAVKVDPTNALLLACTARAILTRAPEPNSGQIRNAEWYSARALQFAPDDAEVWSVRAQVMERAGNLSAGLEAIAHATSLQPQNPAFWLAQARLLEETNRVDEAYQSFTKAIDLAAAEPENESQPRASFYLNRYGFLKRQNRLKEAAMDFCLAKRIPSRDPKAAPELVDLTCYYNASLDERWHPGQEKNDLSSLPHGIQSLAGVLFDVRGLIQVGADLKPGEKYPDRVENIAIGCGCRKLHLLHSAINCSGVSKGTQIGSYSIHYTNGEGVEIPIVLGLEVADWWDQPNEENAGFSVAWEGTNEAARNMGRKIRLFHTLWMNPSPEKIVKSIDFSSVNGNAAPFLVAVTVE